MVFFFFFLPQILFFKFYFLQIVNHLKNFVKDLEKILKKSS